jgi:mRNA-degrading endonuclease RelE of RelBE toxin-antitoxin system
VTPYDLEITAEGRRHLDRLPEKIYPAVMAFMFESLALNPHRVGKPLVAEFFGLWSARRAEYRVIYQIDDDRRVVTIHRVAHRGDAYRRR